MKKQYIPCFAILFFTLLMIVPSLAAADTGSAGYKNITATEANKMIKGCNVFILDVRTPAEFHAAHIKGATLIPFKNVPAHDPVNLSNESLLAARINEVPKDIPVIVYCLTSGRSFNATKLLVQNGYTNIYNMQMGIPAWIDARYPVTSTFIDESGVRSCIKKPLKAKINCVFLSLRMGDDARAKNQLDQFKSFVNETERARIVSPGQAIYLRAEAEEIRQMI
ncbi:MAG: rhodanese-like domain-containing protein [Methanosarcina sp.]